MKHLTLADEIVVLMLDDDTGTLKPSCVETANVAIAGGILMELALLGRIDSDLSSLFVINPAPVGDEILDPVLREIADEPDKRSSKSWVEHLSAPNRGWIKVVLDRLVRAGILREEHRKFLWVFARRAYPQNTGREEREAKGRIVSVVFNDTVPDPRDTLLVSLADSSGVFDAIFSRDERRKASKRIEQVVALEEMGRSVKAVGADLRKALEAARASLI
jgi:Golgi phosphoprotein 3 (GPP34)